MSSGANLSVSRRSRQTRGSGRAIKNGYKSAKHVYIYIYIYINDFPYNFPPFPSPKCTKKKKKKKKTTPSAKKIKKNCAFGATVLSTHMGLQIFPHARASLYRSMPLVGMKVSARILIVSVLACVLLLCGILSWYLTFEASWNSLETIGRTLRHTTLDQARRGGVSRLVLSPPVQTAGTGFLSGKSGEIGGKSWKIMENYGGGELRRLCPPRRR